MTNPLEIRPPRVLLRTLDYLVNQVLPSTEVVISNHAKIIFRLNTSTYISFCSTGFVQLGRIWGYNASHEE